MIIQSTNSKMLGVKIPSMSAKMFPLISYANQDLLKQGHLPKKLSYHD